VTRPEAVAGVEDADLDGETVLVTGATDGIGRETALALGRLGADVIVHGRDPEKGAAVVDDLRALGSDARFERADFADLDAVRGLADAVAGEIDRLVNNAGAYVDDGRLTDAGVEYTTAVNHLAPFLLTCRLVDALPEDGRIVTVASEAHRGVEADLAAAESVADYDGFDAYRRSKLYNVLFTRELDRRLAEAAPTANCLHPGFVPGSELWRDSPWYVRGAIGIFRLLPEPLQRGPVTSVPAAAATSVFLAAGRAGGAVGGRYFADCEVATPSEPARDGDAARRLWEWSAERTGAGID